MRKLTQISALVNLVLGLWWEVTCRYLFSEYTPRPEARRNADSSNDIIAADMSSSLLYGDITARERIEKGVLPSYFAQKEASLGGV